MTHTTDIIYIFIIMIVVGTSTPLVKIVNVTFDTATHNFYLINRIFSENVHARLSEIGPIGH